MAPSPDRAATDTLAPALGDAAFSVSLDNFTGPFDLLLSLIAKHELDITEVSLSIITDEFLSYLHALTSDDELERATEFLVVAATLLDLKVAGLLPQGELVDAEDVTLLEARDLLFARLLQYRAFKEAAVWLGAELASESSRRYRSVRLEDKYRLQHPDLVWTLALDDFAALATTALMPRALPRIAVDHLHASPVSIREQASIVIAILRRGQPTSFRQLIAGVEQAGVIVARFLALLELYRGAFVELDQREPLGELTVLWSAGAFDDTSLASLGSDYGR